jgi:hypothetical protein
MAGKRKHPERDLQIQVVNFLLMMEHRGHLTFFHPPNGGSRGAREGANFKRMGVRAGVSDLVILWRDSIEDGSVGFIELKAGAGRLSKAQSDFHEKVAGFGAYTAIAYTLDDVRGTLDSWEVPGLPSRS